MTGDLGTVSCRQHLVSLVALAARQTACQNYRGEGPAGSAAGVGPIDTAKTISVTAETIASGSEGVEA